MKHPGLFLLLAVIISFPVIVPAQSMGQREKINFDDNWKFHFGHAANPGKDFNYSIATIFSKSGGAYGTAVDPRFTSLGFSWPG